MIFHWVLLTLACYRLQRVITTDSWLPFQWFRTYLNKKAQPAAQDGHSNFWTEAAELFSCPHCMGVWVTAIVYVIAVHYLNIPYPVLQAVATMAGISIIANQEDE